MKKTLFLLLAFSVATISCFTGCKKDNGSSTDYIRGKVDGVAFEANSNMWATPGRPGDKIISFRGDWPGGSIRFYLDGQGSNITTGTYDFTTGIVRNAVVYENNDGYSAGYFCGGFGPCTYYGSGKIIILNISKKHVRGTFEFVTNVSGATGVPKTVSNGEFYMNRD